MTLAVVIVDDAAGAALAGRPAVEWLLDTVEQLKPAVLVAAGAARTAAAGRPALAAALDRPQPCTATLVLPASSPLVRAATLQALVARLDEAPVAVAALEAQASWWADDVAEPRRVVALAGSVPPGDPADLLHDGAGSPGTPVLRVSGVEALWTGDEYERTAAQNAVYARIAAGWVRAGVAVDDPATTRIDASVRIDPGARIRSHTELLGSTTVGRGTCIGPVTTVRDCAVGADCLVHYSVCQDTVIGDGANIGPFAWLRSGSSLGERCRVGAFVEISDSVVGQGTAVPHLAGLYSADVGRDCNVASMSGSLNYNGGGPKQRTRIGDGVSIGSGSILIAPVSIGNGAETAAGSVITEDVPDGALGISRTQQRNVAGWAALRGRLRR